MWWFKQITLGLRKKAFKLVVLALRQQWSYAMFRAQSQGRNGTEIWGKVQKGGKTEIKSSQQNMDTNVRKMPTVARRVRSWSKDMTHIWHRKTGWSKRGETLFLLQEAYMFFSRPPSLLLPLKALLGSSWYCHCSWRIQSPKELLRAVAAQTIFAILNIRIAEVLK